MSRYYPNPGGERRRYQVVMKSWRRLRQNDADNPVQIRFQRRRLLEELRGLDLHDD